jgi:hypothetical protein
MILNVRRALVRRPGGDCPLFSGAWHGGGELALFVASRPWHDVPWDYGFSLPGGRSAPVPEVTIMR